MCLLRPDVDFRQHGVTARLQRRLDAGRRLAAARLSTGLRDQAAAGTEGTAVEKRARYLETRTSTAVSVAPFAGDDDRRRHGCVLHRSGLSLDRRRVDEPHPLAF